MAKLRFIVDEDTDVQVIPFLRSRDHDVLEARVLFGERSKDPEIMAWAAANDAIYLTCDRKFGLSRRFNEKRSAFIVLKDLHELQLERVMDLIETIEREAAALGCPKFFMWITRNEFGVVR